MLFVLIAGVMFLLIDQLVCDSVCRMSFCLLVNMVERRARAISALIVVDIIL